MLQIVLCCQATADRTQFICNNLAQLDQFYSMSSAAHLRCWLLMLRAACEQGGQAGGCSSARGSHDGSGSRPGPQPEADCRPLVAGPIRPLQRGSSQVQGSIPELLSRAQGARVPAILPLPGAPADMPVSIVACSEVEEAASECRDAAEVALLCCMRQICVRLFTLAYHSRVHADV